MDVRLKGQAVIKRNMKRYSVLLLGMHENSLDSSEVEELPAGIHNPALAGNGKTGSFAAEDSDSDSAQSVLDDGTEGYRTMGFKKTLTEDEIKKRFSNLEKASNNSL